MRKGSSKPLTKAQRAELKALEALPDERIDTSDVPEVTDWRDARRGALYRPLKRQLTIRLDADVVDWFQHVSGGRGYQTAINRVLRDYVARQERKREHEPG